MSAEEVASAYVQSNEFNVCIFGSNFVDSFSKSVTGHNYYVITFGNSEFRRGNSACVIVSSGFKIFVPYVVCRAESLACFMRGLVERLVGNVAVIGNHCHFVVFVVIVLFVACACKATESENYTQ